MSVTTTKSPAPELAALRIDDDKREGRPLGKWLGKFAAVVGALVILIGAWLALRSRKPEVEVAAALPPSDAPGATLLNASGYVTPRRRATVAAKITGKVREVYIDEGMRVSEGQILAQLDDSDYVATLNSAKADRDATAAALLDLQVQLGNAERELQRTKDLNAAGIQTPQQLDTAQTLVNSLKARIDLTQEQIVASDAKIKIELQNIENCKVRAPFAGMVVTKDAQPGEMISPMTAGGTGSYTRTGIGTIVDMNSNEIEVDVNENYIARVQPGQHVTAVLDAYPDWQIPAHVRTVIPTADREKGTVKVRVSFEHLDPRILPDMGVKVAFLAEEPTGMKKSGATALVPAQAVRNSGGQSAVLLFRDGTLERRAVRVGQPRAANVEILAGLAPGDLVVVKGPDDLRDGQRVVRK